MPRNSDPPTPYSSIGEFIDQMRFELMNDAQTWSESELDRRFAFDATKQSLLG
jgi:hypothetical protein